MTGAKTSPAQVDLRGFSYPLAPHTLQQQWRMDKLQSQLAKAHAAVIDAQGKLDAMHGVLRTQSEHMQQSLLKTPNPATYQHGLAYLAQLQHQIGIQKQSLDDLREEHARLRAENIAQQRKLDGLEEHKTQSQQIYAAEIIRSEAAEADRDWIGRAHHRVEAQSTPEEAAP